MYLARRETGSQPRDFVLRETVRNGQLLLSRDLIELGPDPGSIFIYDDDCSFRIDETLLQRLRDLGVHTSHAEVEELFFPFIDPYIKNRLQPFRSRSKYRNWRPADAALRQRAMEETWAMDRRRLHFLRLGRSSGEENSKSAALYTTLLDKSRDEIEQLIREQEYALKPREYQSYLFAVFDLQRFFKESYARTIPQALNRERLDEIFVAEICRCAADTDFWRGYPACTCLPPSLVRYLIMYFDTLPEQTPAWARFAHGSGSRRFHRTSSPPGERVTRSQALVLFGLSTEQFAAMNKRDLTRLYRQKALDLHPDTGGDAEQFIRLTRAYEELLPSLR